MSLSRRCALLGASALILSACVAGGRFETDYQPLSPEVSRGWRLAEVQIDVPRSLTVSEARTLLPEADICLLYTSPSPRD